MFVNKMFRLVSVLVILALVVAGCAPKPTPTPAPKPTAVPPTAVPPTAVPKPVELNVWSRFPEIVAVLKAMGEKYNKEHPNVKVTVTLFAQRAMDEKMAIAVPTGEAADVMEIDTISFFSYYKQGFIEPAPADLAAFAKQHLAPSAVEIATDDGAIYAVPYFIGIQCMYYNKDYFAEAGLTRPPETYDEMVEYAKKLTKYDDKGNITRAGLDLRLGGGGYGVAEKYWAMGMIPFGAAPWKKMDGGWKNGYEGEPGEQALQFYLDGLFKHKYDSPEVVSDAEGFGLGLSGMFQRESWVIGTLKQNAPNINYGVFLFPKGPKGWGTSGSASSLGVPKSSKNKDVAFDFVKFCLSEENQRQLLDESGWLPVLVDGDYSAIYAKSPGYETFLKALNTPGFTVEYYPPITPAVEIVGKIADTIVPTFSNPALANDKAAVAKIIKQMATETDRILEDNNLLAKAAPPPAGKPVELNVWSRFPEMQKLLQELGDLYTKEHPNVTVECTLFAQRALDEKIAVALPAGEAADIIEMGGIFTYIAQGMFEELPADLHALLKQTCAPFLLNHNYTAEGKIFTVPTFLGVQIMYYNKDYFKEAGLTRPPETYDEMVEYAKKLTKYDDKGNITRAGLDLRLGGGGSGIADKFWAMAMIPNGGTPWLKVDGGWKNGYEGEPGEKALQFYLDAIFEHKYDSPEVKSDSEGFGLGLSAMFQRESATIAYLRQNAPNINYGTFLFPKGPAGWGTGASGSGLSVTSASKNKDVAFDFIEFCWSPQNQMKLMNDTGWLPGRVVDVDYSSVYANSPAYEACVKSLNTPGYTVYEWPPIPAAEEIMGRIADSIVPTFSNPAIAKDPAAVKELIKKMAAETNRILDENGLLAK